MMLFWIIAFWAVVIAKAYKDVNGKNYTNQEENRLIYMIASIIIMIIAELFSILCIIIQVWSLVIISLVIACFCGGIAYYLHCKLS